jgi:hypothetical protein
MCRRCCRRRSGRPSAASPTIALEEVDADEVVVRIQATPLSDDDGPRLADEVLCAVAAVTHEPVGGDEPPGIGGDEPPGVGGDEPAGVGGDEPAGQDGAPEPDRMGRSGPMQDASRAVIPRADRP